MPMGKILDRQLDRGDLGWRRATAPPTEAGPGGGRGDFARSGRMISDSNPRPAVRMTPALAHSSLDTFHEHWFLRCRLGASARWLIGDRALAQNISLSKIVPICEGGPPAKRGRKFPGPAVQSEAVEACFFTDIGVGGIGVLAACNEGRGER